jgi:uncharacterized membrane protein YhaH (DUF805 family)
MLKNFIGFDGRIGRQSWWLGTVALTVLIIILYLILGAILGASGAELPDPASINDPVLMEKALRSSQIQGLISLAIFLYPGLALMGKRLNDRNRPSWLKYLFYVPAVLSSVLGVFGLTYFVTKIEGELTPYPTTLGTILTLLSLVAAIWAVIELGFLRGTDGPNRYGADPIAD